jgi:hypothetical protein
MLSNWPLPWMVKDCPPVSGDNFGCSRSYLYEGVGFGARTYSKQDKLSSGSASSLPGAISRMLPALLVICDGSLLPLGG